MARNERDGAKERFWRDAARRQAGSGLSVRGFCRREKLTESNFYTWRRVIAKRDAEARPSKKRPAFVPAIVTDVPRQQASIIIELGGGRRLRLPSSMPMRRLARLVHALEAGPRTGEGNG
jgi:transposase